MENIKRFQPAMLTDEKKEQLLSENVKESQLSDFAKWMLAWFINQYDCIPNVMNNGYLFVSNVDLQKAVKKNWQLVMSAINELIDTNLLVRVAGESRKNGCKAIATKYYVQFENLFKPIVIPTAEEKYKKFMSKTINNVVPTVEYNEKPDVAHDAYNDLSYELEIAERDLQYEMDRLKGTTTEKEKEYAEYWVNVRQDKVRELKEKIENEVSKRV